MDAGPAVMPTLDALRAARAHQDAIRRWLLPAGPVVVIVLTLSAVQAVSPLGLHGRSLAALLAVVAFATGGLGAMVTRRAAARVQLPFVALLFAGAITLVAMQPEGSGVFGLFIGVALTAQHMRRRGARVATTAILIPMVVATVVVSGHRAPLSGVLAGVAVSSFVGLSLLAARLRDANLQAEQLLIELEQTRQAHARAAALAERQRMAREIHDVLAHSLSGLVLQLDAAHMLSGTGDPRLTPTIDRARHLARTGLDEARHAIGTLRDDAVPGPEMLGPLVAEYRHTTGIACDLMISGPERPLEPQIGLAVYRVAQEALTNAAKHAGPDRVTVRLTYGETTARLTVEDTGDPGGAAVDADGPGFGLIGMRERAELLGGTLHAGRTDDGFRVDLVVPG
jgi:signal transduction histidine kinase